MIYSIDKTNNPSQIVGKVVDEFGEIVLFAAVVLKQNGVLVTGTQTDFDGLFSFSNIAVGDYTITVSYVGYATLSTGVSVQENEQVEIESFIIQDVLLEEINGCTWYCPPLIELDNTTQGQIFKSWEIQRSPIKN